MVSATTKESNPSAPRWFEKVGVSDTSATLEWYAPEVSFLFFKYLNELKYTALKQQNFYIIV